MDKRLSQATKSSKRFFFKKLASSQHLFNNQWQKPERTSDVCHFLLTSLNNTDRRPNRESIYFLSIDWPPWSVQEVYRIKRTEQRLTSRARDSSFTHSHVWSAPLSCLAPALNHGGRRHNVNRSTTALWRKGKGFNCRPSFSSALFPALGAVKPGQVPGRSGYYRPPQWCCIGPASGHWPNKGCDSIIKRGDIAQLTAGHRGERALGWTLYSLRDQINIGDVLAYVHACPLIACPSSVCMSP